VQYGLLGAAALAGALIVLLLIGADGRQLRGAGAAAALAAVVLLVPLVLALLGEDYYIPRALMPAWIPLAVLVGAACTAPRVRVAGAILGATLLASFVYAQVKIEGNSQYQRPDWRGVAQALGTPVGPRAIVAYDGGAATDPLAFYLPGVPWSSATKDPLTVSEVAVVGHRWQSLARPLPPGVHLIDSRTVDDFIVVRFSIDPAQRRSLSEIGGSAGQLLGPPLPSPAVLIQNPPSAR
jgi:hypothetical protein